MKHRREEEEKGVEEGRRRDVYIVCVHVDCCKCVYMCSIVQSC